MQIYILRHGIAKAAGPRVQDFKRELTKEGRKKLERVLKAARRGGVRPGLVVSSRLVRAVQTAEMARKILKVKAAIHETRALVPGSAPQQVWEELRGLKDAESVLLAGHEPMLSSLAAWLLGAPDVQIHMTKAAMVCIEIEQLRGEPRGLLRWMITPKLAG